MRESTCCFTGHRKIPPTERDKIAARLEETIIQLYQRGIANFIAGGALGFDTMAAEAVLRLRESLPEIKLILALPCENQGRKWSANSTQRYEKIKQMANEVVYVSRDYTHDCMHKRNRYMVDNSSVCVCYQTKDTGGTAYTVGYAKEQGIDVIRLLDSKAKQITATSALSRFHIKKNYKGYPYLVHAIEIAVNELPKRLAMEELCERLAELENVPAKTITRELTRVTNKLWKNLPNLTVYAELIGSKVKTEPLMLEFIYIMAEEIKNN